MNCESSRVSIEITTRLDDAIYDVSRHESGTIGDIEIGSDIANAMMGIGGRVMYELAAAVVAVDVNQPHHGDEFPSDTAFALEAKKLVAAWKKYDDKKGSAS